MKLKRRLKQLAWYLAPAGRDAFGGLVYATPELISVRWEDKQERFTPTIGVAEQDGRIEEVVSFAIVWSDRKLALEGKLQLVESPSDAFNAEDASLIRRRDVTPALRANTFVCKAWLV